MRQYLTRLPKGLIAVAIATAIISSISLPARALTVPPGDSTLGPTFCPQIEVSTAAVCPLEQSGRYKIELVDGAIPLTNRNFIPCNSDAIDSYFPPNGQQIRVVNLGETDLSVNFVCD